jgi:hypothetical protein
MNRTSNQSLTLSQNRTTVSSACLITFSAVSSVCSSSKSCQTRSRCQRHSNLLALAFSYSRVIGFACRCKFDTSRVKIIVKKDCLFKNVHKSRHLQSNSQKLACVCVSQLQIFHSHRQTTTHYTATYLVCVCLLSSCIMRGGER